MEGNWLYAVLGKNSLAQTTAEHLPLVFRTRPVLIYLGTAPRVTRRILLSARHTWIRAEDDALPVADLCPFQNPTVHDPQHLGRPAGPSRIP